MDCIKQNLADSIFNIQYSTDICVGMSSGGMSSNGRTPLNMTGKDSVPKTSISVLKENNKWYVRNKMSVPVFNSCHLLHIFTICYFYFELLSSFCLSSSASPFSLFFSPSLLILPLSLSSCLSHSHSPSLFLSLSLCLSLCVYRCQNPQYHLELENPFSKEEIYLKIVVRRVEAPEKKGKL